LKKLKILGIYRNPKFSNNAIEVDRLILEESIQQLKNKFTASLDLTMIEEDEALETTGHFDLVLTMAQAEQTLAALDRNLPTSTIWNSPSSIRNCYRKTMSRILSGLPVGYVPYQLFSTNSPGLPKIVAGESYWLKRSDFHAIADEDVTLAESEGELKEKISRFRSRDVSEVIVQRHIHGDIYKFYGVRGKFFRAIKVRSFLTEATAPDLKLLENNSFLAAQSLGLMVFGGDAILDASGRFHFIDLNDWPSFRICRDVAAPAIGELAADFLESAVESSHTPASTPVHA